MATCWSFTGQAGGVDGRVAVKWPLAGHLPVRQGESAGGWP